MLSKCTKCGQVVEPINGYCPYCDNDMHEFEEDPIDYSKAVLREINVYPSWAKKIVKSENSRRTLFTILSIVCFVSVVALFALGFIFEILWLLSIAGILFIPGLFFCIIAVRAHKPFFFLNQFGDHIIGYALIRCTTAVYVDGHKIKCQKNDAKTFTLEGWDIVCAPSYVKDATLQGHSITAGPCRSNTIRTSKVNLYSINHVDFTAIKVSSN